MTEQEATGIFSDIQTQYNSLKEPKYKYVQVDTFKQQYEQILSIKSYFKESNDYMKLLNGMTQVLKKLESNATPQNENKEWRNVSERGMNKVILPVTKKRNQEISFPLQWVDEKSKEDCFISNGNWSTKNFMVLDVLGYILLLKEGGNVLPKESAPIFSDLGSITLREKELDNVNNTVQHLPAMNDQDIQQFKNKRYYVHFNDKNFRKYTDTDMSSNDIFNLLLETSRVEFKLVYPVRLQEGKDAKEKLYNMNLFSRFFEFGYIDRDIRSDGIVRSREYYVAFSTILGELFAHNLLSQNYDWVDSSFYTLPYSAQILYRRFLIHNDYVKTYLNLKTIVERLNLKDKNTTNLIKTIEESALKPLMEHGLIDSYEKEDGLQGLRFTIKRLKKTKPTKEIAQ